MARLPARVMKKKRGNFQSTKKNDKPMTKCCRQIKQDKIRRSGKSHG